MSNEKKDGGPAFPRQHTVADANDKAFKQGHDGMTLRDYFAAKAMQVAFQQALGAKSDEDSAAAIGLVPRLAYTMADAMIKAREQ